MPQPLGKYQSGDFPFESLNWKLQMGWNSEMLTANSLYISFSCPDWVAPRAPWHIFSIRTNKYSSSPSYSLERASANRSSFSLVLASGLYSIFYLEHPLEWALTYFSSTIELHWTQRRSRLCLSLSSGLLTALGKSAFPPMSLFLFGFNRLL